MKKKDYISPQVRQYLIEGPLEPFAASRNPSVKIDGEDVEVDGNDNGGTEADSRKFDGWSWDD